MAQNNKSSLDLPKKKQLVLSQILPAHQMIQISQPSVNEIQIQDQSNSPMILPDAREDVLNKMNRKNSNGNPNTSNRQTPKGKGPQRSSFQYGAKGIPLVPPHSGGKLSRRTGINIQQIKNANKDEPESKGFMRIPNTKTKIPQTKYEKFKCFLTKLLDNEIEISIVAGLSILGLILSDIKILYVPKKYEIIFIVIYVIIMLSTFCEIIASSISEPEYFLSFFFFLDIFSIFSLLTEQDSVKEGITKAILGDNSEEVGKIHYAYIIIKVIKIIRLIRVFKVYKAALGLMKHYEIKKKLEQIQAKEIERIKKKTAMKRTKSGIVPPTVITQGGGGSTGNIAGLVTQTTQQNQGGIYNSTISGIQSTAINLNPLLKPLENNYVKLSASQGLVNTSNPQTPIKSTNTLNINTSMTINSARGNNSTSYNNQLAEFALKKVMYKVQTEKKQLLIMQSKTQTTQVLFATFTKMLLYLTLLLFLLSPIFDTKAYSKLGGANYQFLSNLIENEVITIDMISPYSNKNFPIIEITQNNSTIFINSTMSDNSVDDFRFLEKSYVLSENKTIKVIFSNKKVVKTISNVNIVRTFIFFLILTALSYLINDDTSNQILKPIDSMLNIVETIAQDPVNYKKLDELNKNTKMSIERMNKNSTSDDEETSLHFKIKTVQIAVIRISKLIALGFGEAGGEILKENISSEQELNPMIPGKKVQAVFGFCFIRNFTLINEALQDKTISFVNTIAIAIHSSVKKFGGECNKNIGDAFLFVWKFKNCGTQEAGKGKKSNDYLLKHKDDPDIIRTAESALVSFLCAIKKIYKSQTILQFRNDQKLKKKFGGEFKVKMGFGLHCGWAIEGTIGSFCKIDCSYLSPNVNTSARIETATNQFGVDILFSGDLHNYFSPYTKKICRQVDTVALKGCLFPIKLYTVDFNQNLRPGKPKTKEIQFKERLKRINYKKDRFKKMSEKKEDDETKTILSITEVYYKWSRGFREMLKEPRTNCFLTNYYQGFDYYIKGDWPKAQEFLKRALYIQQADQPTAKLIKIIHENNGVAPEGWKGFRKLESK